MASDKVYLTTVTPVYQGAPYLGELVERLADLKTSIDGDNNPLVLSEAIFVDDSSVDNSIEILRNIQEQHPWVRIIELSKNYGQHPATIAGLLHSSGDWVATIDEDLQHDPKYLIPMLVHAIKAKNDLVYAKPESGVHQKFFRDAFSKMYKALISKLSGNPFTRDFNSFRLLRGSVARAAASVASHETYLDVALTWFTNRISSLTFPLKDIRFIQEKKSGYRFRSLLSHARRMLVSSEIRALRLGQVIGMITLSLSIILGVITLIKKLLFPESIPVRGWTSLMLALLLIGGFISFLVGILLDYIKVLLLQAQGKPTFFVVDRSKDALLMPFVEKYDKK